MKEWTGEARTADAAVDRGLARLGLRRDEVDVHVLGEKSSGLLSLFGFRWVKVRLSEKRRGRPEGRSYEYEERDDEEGRREERVGRPVRQAGTAPGGGRGGNRRGDRSRPEDSQNRRETFQGKGRTESAAMPPRTGVSAAPGARDSAAGPADRSARGEGRRRDRGGNLPRETNPRRQSPKARSGNGLPDPPRSQGVGESEGRRRPRGSPPPQAAGEAARTPTDPRQEPAAFRPFIPPESLLAQWKDLLGWEDLTWAFEPAENRRLTVQLKTSRGERLAGSGGRALEAFEYLFNLISSGGDREKPWVSFHLEGFPSADEHRVVDQALHAAFQVRRTGRPFRLDPMPSARRRMVHQALARHPDVETASEGEGPLRQVVVKPKGSGVKGEGPGTEAREQGSGIGG